MIVGIDIEDLRVRIGLPPDDASRDEELEAAADQAMSLCETFCDRWFEKKTQIEQIRPAHAQFLVKRYPIESVTSITDANGDVIDSGLYRTVDSAGIVLKGGCSSFGVGAWPMTIEYIGGFDPLPKDFEFAVLRVFDLVWASTPGWGATKEMEKITVVGVGSIDFAASSSGSSSGGGDDKSDPMSTVKRTLQRYMNHTVIGGA